MGNVLSERQVAEFGRTGIIFPLPGVGAAEGDGLLHELEALERRDGGKLSKKSNHKPHLLLRRFADLVRDPRILDPIEDVIGPDIFCWSAGFFMKNPNDRARVTWHQDSTYWGLSSPDVVTAWVAFTPSTVETGCMRVIPGTHLVDQLPHRETYAADNLLSRGQRSRLRSTSGRRSTSCSRRGRSRSITCASSTARSPMSAPIAASASRSATCRPTSASSTASATTPRWCAATTRSAISCTSRYRPPTSTPPSWRFMPRPTRLRCRFSMPAP